MASGREVISHQLFPEFKRYLAVGQKLAADVLADLARYARVYETFEKEPATTELGQFLYRLNTLEVTTAYPALLWLLGPGGANGRDGAGRRLARDRELARSPHAHPPDHQELQRRVPGAAQERARGG